MLNAHATTTLKCTTITFVIQNHYMKSKKKNKQRRANIADSDICEAPHQSLSQLQLQLWFSQTLVNHVVQLFSDDLINCTSFSLLALEIVINVKMCRNNFEKLTFLFIKDLQIITKCIFQMLIKIGENSVDYLH